VIAELDLVGAAPFDDEATTAGRVAGTPIVTVERDESLARAALLMAEYATTHLVVVGADGTPEGIVSALDLAVAVAPPPPRAKVEGEEPAPELRASAGDRLLIHPHHLGEPQRDGEVLEAQGPGGSAPFLVRWEDTGRVSLFYPGSDARIRHLARG
jgi:CBS domain-containing protein